MNAANLDTTNLLLGIMAAVSVLEAVLLVGIGVMAYKLYGQAMRTIREVEQRQIAPLVTRVDALMTRVDAILGDVRDVTSRVSTRTERVDSAIRQHRVFALFNAARAAVDGFVHPRRHAPGGAPEHA